MSDDIFEGDDVTDYVLMLPTGSKPAPTAYPHGTLLTLTMHVRVKSVRLEEDRRGNLIRKHALAVDDMHIEDSLTPAERRAIEDAVAVAEDVTASANNLTSAE